MGAAYSLVGVPYQIALGGSRKNHFVTQLRVRGRWHKYDCLAGGAVLFLQTPSTPTGTARRSVYWRTSRPLCASPPHRFTRDTSND
ncbi:unnamed protein product, partial [Ectocarpus sp. 12 AP-2014]